MKNFAIISFLFLIVGCTSDVEKAKQLGFSSVSEMATLNEMGYKSYEEFNNAHPFVSVDTLITKFAGAELGKPALKYSQKIDTLERPQMYKTSKDVYIDTSWADEKIIKRITFNCNSSKADKVKLGNIDCSSTEVDLQSMKLKTLCDVYAEESPESPIFYIKDKAFYSTNSEGKVQWLGIASEGHFDKEWTGGEVPSKLIACSAVTSWKNKAANGGFKSIYEMDSAAEKGISNNSDWIAYKATEKFASYKNNSNGEFQKSLVLFASTAEDFDRLKDNGGLKFDDKWKGYRVTSVEVGYKKSKLSWFIMQVDEDYRITNKKLASLNNVKSDLSVECGYDWKRVRVSDDDGFAAEGEFASCRIYPSRNGGIGIEVFSNSKN